MRFLSAVLTAATMLGYALPLATQAQGNWPIKAFEVIDGDPAPLLNRTKFAIENPHTIIEGLQNRAINQIKGGAYHLTPQLKQEMERYLGEVAREFERQGFPPPVIDDVVTRSDGSKAYAIYYSFLNNTPFRAAEVPAVFSYRCAGETGGHAYILFNALGLTDGTGKITDKGYGDLAHEVFHAVQRGTPFYRRNCEPPGWITEGLAQAIGYDTARRLRGVNDPDFPEDRWGLRVYSIPLTSTPVSDSGRQYTYATSSFWRYLAELEHARRLPTHPTHEAGPPFKVPYYDTDYRLIARMLNKAQPGGNDSEAVAWLDHALANDGVPDQTFAEHYTKFVQAYAAYGQYRPVGTNYRDHLRRWLGPCQTAKPIALVDRSSRLPLRLDPISAACVALPIGLIGQPLSVDIRANVASRQIAEQLWLGVVDDRRLAPGIVSENADGTAVVSWSLGVGPQQSFDLVVTNVATQSPQGTKPASIDLEIGLAGWRVSTTPPNHPAAPTPKPATRPPQPSPQPGETTQDGLGSTAVERDREDAVIRCGPAREFGSYCGPMLSIHLKTVATAMSGFGSMITSGGGIAQALATVNEMGGAAGLGAAGMAALAAREQLAVDISIPLPRYGQTGTIQGAKIIVRGGDLPERGAYGPQDVQSGPQTYFPASGEVEIEAYSITELRGTFSATLVELPMPNNRREDRPTLPTLGTIRGRFLITRPWEGDGQFTMIIPPKAQLMGGAMTRPPAANASTGPAADRPPPTRTGTGTAGGGAVGPCACTCEEKRAVFGTLDNVDDINPLLPSADAMKMAMCTMACGAAYASCPD